MPAAGGGFSATRRLAGFAFAAAGLPALTGLLVALRGQLSLESVLLHYTLAVVLVAITVSITVDLAARSRVSAARNRIEADLLSRFAAAPVDDTSLTTVLEQVRETFGMTSVALLGRGRDGAVGPPLRGRSVHLHGRGRGLRLVAEGPEIFARTAGC